MSFCASVGELGVTAAGSLGEGTVTVLTSMASSLSAVFAWLLACVTCIPPLISSAIALMLSPFQSVSIL